jgi:transcriptional regulator with XRE-family HTH domain
MIEPARLRAVMAEREVSQSELARRVGVSQQTIFKLTTGQSLNSRYLHQIARELGTTPAYLSGETTDPESDAPDPPEFSPADIELLQRIALLSDRARDAMMILVDELAEASGRTLNTTRRGLRARSQG